MSLGALLRQRAREIPDREFLRFEGRSLTFADVDRLTNAFAQRMLSAGVAPGDRVALRFANGLSYPLAWLAAAKLGAVAVPINPQYRDRDLGHILSDSGAVLALTHEGGQEVVASAAPGLVVLELPATLDLDLIDDRDLSLIDDPGPDALLNIQYTSGTTGLPKGVMISHYYWIALGQQAARYAELGPDDVALTAQPFFYLDPQWSTTMCLVAGIPLVIMPRFSASSFWESVVKEGITYFYVVGAMPLMLFKQPPGPAETAHQVRHVSCSGIPPQLHAEYEERWGMPWREAYGLTETGVDLIMPFTEVDCVGSGSIGYPVDGKEVAILDLDGVRLGPGEEGEIAVRGRPLMLGYWNNRDATARVMRDGWFRTGDLGRYDERGRFYITGRIKDMIRRSGENISAAEVEAVLAEHPGVLAAAVVAVPDEVRGEEAMAFVQPAGDDVAPSALVAFLEDKLASFKIPRYFAAVDRFPMTPSQRIAKHELVGVLPAHLAGAFDRQAVPVQTDGGRSSNVSS